MHASQLPSTPDRRSASSRSTTMLISVTLLVMVPLSVHFSSSMTPSQRQLVLRNGDTLQPPEQPSANQENPAPTFHVDAAAATPTSGVGEMAGVRRSEGVCFPASVPLLSRVSFPKLALDLHRYLYTRRLNLRPHGHALPTIDTNRSASIAANGGTKDPRRVFRVVEIGSLYCVNIFSFRTVLEAYADPEVEIEFYSVDMWGYRGVEEGAPDQNTDLVGQLAHRHCTALFANVFQGTKLIKGRSVEVAATFSDGFFDFIYIDALHTYSACKADMEAWWPKLKPGGLFSGDDYGDFSLAHLAHWEAPYNRFNWGVIRAVQEFTLSEGLAFATTSQEHKMHPVITKMIPKLNESRSRDVDGNFFTPLRGFPNWYLIKPHPEFDMSCRTVVNTESWLSKFEAPFARRGASSRVVSSVETLRTGWTRVASQSSSSDRLPFLLYLPWSIVDPIPIRSPSSTAACTLIVHLHGKSDGGPHLYKLIRKEDNTGNVPQILEGLTISSGDALHDSAAAHLDSHPLLRRGGVGASVVVIAPLSEEAWTGSSDVIRLRQMIEKWLLTSKLDCDTLSRQMRPTCQRISFGNDRNVIVTGSGDGGAAVVRLLASVADMQLDSAAGRAMAERVTFVALCPSLSDVTPSRVASSLRRTGQMDEASEATSRRSPKLVLVHGANDDVVPVNTTEAFVAHLKQETGSNLSMETVAAAPLLNSSSTMQWPEVLFVKVPHAFPPVGSNHASGHGVWRNVFSAGSAFWGWV